MSLNVIGVGMPDPEQFREFFPHTHGQQIYLNHAAISPLPTPVVNAVNRHLNERNSGGIDHFEEDLRIIALCREHLATLLHLDSTDDLAFVPNTSEGLNIAAGGLRWKRGDRILINDVEFPANVYPYTNLRKSGVETDIIKADRGRVTPSMIEKGLSPRTRMVAISAVQFLSGYRADLAAIGKLCRDRGILFVVDAIQAAGAIDINLANLPIDILAAGGHKWQFAPQGIGFLYVRPEVREQIDQQHLGWLSVEEPWKLFDHDQKPDRTAARYENGTMNIPGIYGYEAALSMLLSAGITAIEQRVLALTGDLIAQLDILEAYTPFLPEERAGIATFLLPGELDAEKLLESLKQHDLIVAIRNGMLRISPHFYNTDEEIKKAAETVRTCLDLVNI